MTELPSGLPAAGTAKQLDPSSIRALAHPLRIRLLGRLRAHGPATSAQLAREFDQNTGATSYHLRQLERHGFVADDPSRGTGRERWWRALHSSTSWNDTDFVGDARSQAAADAILRAQLDAEINQVRRWLAERSSWDHQWHDAAASDDAMLRLTPVQLRALADEVAAVIARYQTGPDAGDARDARNTQSTQDARTATDTLAATELIAVYFRAFPTTAFPTTAFPTTAFPTTASPTSTFPTEASPADGGA